MDTVVGENDTASATMVLARIKWRQQQWQQRELTEIVKWQLNGN
jgi:hypothetical protein